MKRVWGIALLVGIGLIFAGESQAKTAPHRAKCRAGYVRRTVWVPKRRHGRIVRTYGLIVYTRVQRCVKVKKPKSPGSGSTTATTTTILLPPFPPIGSGPPFSSPGPPPPPPAASPPANTAPPTISGTATDGSTLSASTGTWANAPTSYGYQWQRCSGSSCSGTGGTASSYLLTNADVGSTLRVSVTASNAAGSASATSASTGTVGSGSSPGDPVVVAVGDIACDPEESNPGACQQSATEMLAASENPRAVLILGDNQYQSGAFSEYTAPGAYGSTWGTFNPIVHPVPGNHEYSTSGAAGYFQYFGQAIANPDNTPGGYYSFNIGSWHIDALNSNCSDQSGCADALTGGTTSAQTAWLQNDLANNKQPCVLAMWHHPLISYGWTLGTPSVAPLWQPLYSAHADVVLNGHDHLYERFAQMNPTGNADSTGIREFVVGTGGESLNGLYGSRPPATLQANDSSDYGVLVLTLHASSYSWSFVNTGGQTIDSGTTACHSKGSGASGAVAPRVTRAVNLAALSGPPFVFNARPLRSSLTTILRRGLPVAIQLSRAADVTVTVSVRRGKHVQQIASFHETESEIPKPYSDIFLRLPARQLIGLGGARLVLKFVAVDSAGHRRMQTTNVSLGNG
jgi:acid phosphatase type 7